MPFAFDLSSRGFLADRAGRDFVVKARPDYGGGSVATPEVLLMTPEGKVVAKASNYASTEQLLAVLRRALKQNAKFAQAAAVEKKLTAEDRAEYLIDLLDDAGALKALGKTDSARAHYLRGRIARWKGDFDAMDAHTAKVKDKSLWDDILMERAYRHWSGKAYKKLEQALASFPKDSNRATEAAYHHGLALFHQDRKKAALKVWKALIAAHQQDRWIYRADWAVCASQQKRGRGVVMMSSGQNSNSALGRIGYMGRPHPDLRRR